MKNQKKAYLYALSAIFFWSTAATAFKISLRYMDFIQLLFYSTTVSIVCLFIIIAAQGKIYLIFSTTRKSIFYSAINGLLNPFAYYMVLLKAYSMLPAQIAQPLNYTWPLVLVVLSVPLLGQKLKARSFNALLISLFGVFIISTQGNFAALRIENPFGVFLAASSSVIWALFWIFNVKDKRDEAVKLFMNFLFGWGYILIALLFFSDFSISKPIGFLPATYVGLFELGITFFLWMRAMQLTFTNEKIGNLVYISPFLSLVFIAWILNENIYYTTLIGLFFIIGGIALQKLRKKNTTQ